MERSISDFFKKQAQQFVLCPACENSVSKSKLNKHLDSECISSSVNDNGLAETNANECVKDHVKNKSSVSSEDTYSSIDKKVNVSQSTSEDFVSEINEKIYTTENMDSVMEENNMLIESGSPYYLANFKHVVSSVLEDTENVHLFNDNDLGYINSFNCISVSSQKLYIRLFQRKFRWHRHHKITYPEIAVDLTYFFQELISKGFLDSDISNLDLESALDLLSLPETKGLSKQFSIIPGNKSKKDIAQLLLKHSRQHKSFFAGSKSSISSAILKKVQPLLSPCYKLALEPKRMFTRILMLFSLPNIAEDEDEAAGGQQQQLFTLLQVNKGELKFPKYGRNRKTCIFQSRDDLIRFEEAKQLENDILIATESKNLELAKQNYENALEKYKCFLDGGFQERDSTLPQFLKRYTAGHVFVKCLWLGVEVLQKLRSYKEAVAQLNKLLEQDVYCWDYRSRFWDRLALNLDQHLKQREKAVEVIKNALKDNCVRGGHRMSLVIRAQRLNSLVDPDEVFKTQISEAMALTEASKVVIRGRLFPRTLPGRKHVFISAASCGSMDNDVTVLGVEDLALEHYKLQGFTEGIHGEGSTFITLYALLFWDILYNGDIPDAFISPYQSHPLDLNSDCFFQSREEHISDQLQLIRNSTIEVLQEIVSNTWNSHVGELSLVSWDKFNDLEQVQGLIKCMGTGIIGGICDRLSRDFRHTRSGVPDLVVWNPRTGDFKVVEVKGPGDKLSTKQMLWIDYLIKIGAQVEVCLVEAVGAKRLKRDETL